jgi:hypothetical protein
MEYLCFWLIFISEEKKKNSAFVGYITTGVYYDNNILHIILFERQATTMYLYI